jgi:hypothetical protein
VEALEGLVNTKRAGTRNGEDGVVRGRRRGVLACSGVVVELRCDLVSGGSRLTLSRLKAYAVHHRNKTHRALNQALAALYRGQVMLCIAGYESFRPGDKHLRAASAPPLSFPLSNHRPVKPYLRHSTLHPCAG